MGAPIIRGINIGHRRRDAALSHDGVCFAEQRLADDADACALRQRFNCRAQPRATRADYQSVVFVVFVFSRHSNLISLIAPDAASRTYKSASPTENRLSQ